jgi:hypothetical protein
MIASTFGAALAQDSQPTKAPAAKTKAEPAAKTEAKAAAAKKTAEEITLPPQVPKNVDEALGMARDGFNAGKAKNWWGMSAIGIWLLMFILKLFKVFKKIGKRWAYILVPALSIVAMLLSKFAGDLSWAGAIAILTSGPTVALLNDMVKRGVLAKEHQTPVNGGAATASTTPKKLDAEG